LKIIKIFLVTCAQLKGKSDKEVNLNALRILNTVNDPQYTKRLELILTGNVEGLFSVENLMNIPSEQLF
jgi:hypothetical protein